MSLDQPWRVEISIESGSWDGLRYVVKNLAAKFAKAELYEDRPMEFGGGCGIGIDTSVRCEYECPVEAKISQLRKEADELEASLKRPAEEG